MTIGTLNSFRSIDAAFQSTFADLTANVRLKFYAGFVSGFIVFTVHFATSGVLASPMSIVS